MDDEHAVVVIVRVERAIALLQSGFARLGQAVDPTPASDDALHMRDGPGSAHREQSGFRLGSRDAGQRPYLRVGELASR